MIIFYDPDLANFVICDNVCLTIKQIPPHLRETIIV